MDKRTAEKTRKTTETEIKVELNIDGTGEYQIDTGIGFLDHMLELFAFWGHFDLKIKVNKSDFKIDIHHTNEDVGILLGQTFKDALGDKKGIKRFGDASVPMEDVVASVAVDISGRGFLKFCGFEGKESGNMIGSSGRSQDGYKLGDVTHFFDALAKNLGMNLNIRVPLPILDLHTTLEPVFKALGIALDQATQIDPRRKGIPSTKGVID